MCTHSRSTAGPALDLTPSLPDYVLRGIDVQPDGAQLALTTVDADGFTPG
jgi:hypothetical protein